MINNVKITYTGQCGFLIEICGARIVTDPYLSDYVDKPGDKTGDWTRAYPPPCTLYELEPDCVIISHSHGDHMDIKTLTAYARAGGHAVVCAPASECALMGDTGITNITGALAETPVSVGEVSILPIACAHQVFHTDARGRYRELSYFIRGGGASILFGGDMSLYEGLEARIAAENPDIMLLPVNGADDIRARMNIIGNMNSDEAAFLARLSKSNAYIPMHHDLYRGNGETIANIQTSAARAGTRAIILKPGETFGF